MIRDAHNVIPLTMSVALHAILLGAMLVAYDFARTVPVTPLAIRATLVTDSPEFAAPRPVEPQPEPEPEPEVLIEEPEPEPAPESPAEPDNSEELRRQAEEEKRQQDALVEQERLEQLRLQQEAERQRLEQEEREQQERQAKAEAEQKKREAAEEAERKKREAAEEAERLRREEEEKEQKRIEAEKQREADIRRQREENERLRREAEDLARADEIAAEENRMAAVDAGALAVYTAKIRQKIERNWSAPASAGAELECSVRVRQIPGGEVVGVSILSCNGDEAVRRSVEAAIYRSSPLPEPSDPSLFDRNILLNLSIRQ
ncbi:MAG: cell envelope integrity protein TolA [Woeseiaceae bacterium]|nr:cell envelope integrity protein TolA [Woeseiaceae bacterium]